MWHSRFNRVHRSLVKLPVALIQASCENVILSAVQLFWLALITRLLLLLLAVLIILVIVTALIAT